MSEEVKNRVLSEAELEKANGGCNESEDQIVQEMICEHGHEWSVRLSDLEDCPEEEFRCPYCGSTDVRRKN